MSEVRILSPRPSPRPFGVLVAVNKSGGQKTMQVRIYKPAKNAMQSGHGNSKRWLLKFEQTAPREVEPLMGWTSSADTRSQVNLWFETAEEAVAYAEKHGYMYYVDQPKQRKIKPKGYADNFANNRLLRWTH